jgi:hypothetical protein
MWLGACQGSEGRYRNYSHQGPTRLVDTWLLHSGKESFLGDEMDSLGTHASHEGPIFDNEDLTGCAEDTTRNKRFENPEPTDRNQTLGIVRSYLRLQ